MWQRQQKREIHDIIGKEVVNDEVYYLVEWSATLMPKYESGNAKGLVDKFEEGKTVATAVLGLRSIDDALCLAIGPQLLTAAPKYVIHSSMHWQCRPQGGKRMPTHDASVVVWQV
jgi:hypothetical protein